MRVRRAVTLTMIHRLLNHLFRYDDLLRDYSALVLAQQLLIDMKNAEISALKLEHARWARDILASFLTADDDPALRNTLAEGLSDMADQVARLEEHHA